MSQFIQVQRGLGASALGLSSVGGTMNMVTKSTEAQKEDRLISASEMTDFVNILFLFLLV